MRAVVLVTWRRAEDCPLQKLAICISHDRLYKCMLSILNTEGLVGEVVSCGKNYKDNGRGDRAILRQPVGERA